MADRLTPARRSENMRRIRSTDTLPEMRVRKLAHALGYRFRLHRRDLPGKPDLTFPRLHKVIFVHGCFFHQHRGCPDGHLPKSRQGYWHPKLARNVARDRMNRAKLTRMGWRSLVMWDCETMDEARTRRVLTKFLAE
jgi:DNA mismatch endonuclease (patch repair protein)